MDRLTYRLNMCVNKYDYKQRLDIYNEIANIANRNINYYKDRISDAADYNNVRVNSEVTDLNECDDCCASCSSKAICVVSCTNHSGDVICTECRYK